MLATIRAQQGGQDPSSPGSGFPLLRGVEERLGDCVCVKTLTGCGSRALSLRGTAAAGVLGDGVRCSSCRWRWRRSGGSWRWSDAQRNRQRRKRRRRTRRRCSTSTRCICRTSSAALILPLLPTRTRYVCEHASVQRPPRDGALEVESPTHARLGQDQNWRDTPTASNCITDHAVAAVWCAGGGGGEGAGGRSEPPVPAGGAEAARDVGVDALRGGGGTTTFGGCEPPHGSNRRAQATAASVASLVRAGAEGRVLRVDLSVDEAYA
jgi:hypothetical protein